MNATPIDLAAIPAELRALPCWVRWKLVPDEPRPRKIPIRPASPGPASSTNPETWGAFDEALAHAGEHGTCGVGFVFRKEDGFVGIDLDDCLTEEGQPDRKATERLSQFPTYAEKSPSGTGLHLIARGSLNGHRGLNRKKEAGIEVYDSGRFFTFTGKILAGAPTAIAGCQAALEALVAELDPLRPATPPPPPRRRSLGGTGLIERARAYTSRMPAAISGQNGHNTTFNVALALIKGFSLDSGAALDLLREFSNRCEPPWSENELLHKIEDAAKADVPDGYIVNRDPPQGAAARVKKGGRALGRSKVPLPAATDAGKTEATRGPDVVSRPLTDVGNAERFVTQHGNSVRYVHPWAKWIIFDGSRWARDEALQIEQLARRTARAIYFEAAGDTADQRRKEIAAHAIKSERRERIDAMVKLSRSDRPVIPAELDADPWLLNVSNGTLDLRTGNLRPHNREDLITKLVPIAFDEKAKCPTFDEFLKKVFGGSSSLLGFIQRAVGYSLTGVTTEQVMFLLHGTGANGKTTLIETLKLLEGEYARQAEFSTFLETDHQGARNDVAALKGARIVMAVEADARRALSESVVKQITGGDTIAARFLYGELFEFKPQLKLWLAANHRPHIRGTDHAIWRRVRIVPFTVTIAEDERDPNMAEKLAAELAGILAWAMRGCADWQEKGLAAPEEVTSATAEYRADEDQVGRFLEDACVLNPQATTPTKTLFAAYRKWCESVGEKESTQKGFGDRLSEKGLRPGRGNRGRYWTGIHLPAEGHDA